MVRVLHLLTALGHGGAEIWLLNMLRQMDRRDCAMDFCLKVPSMGSLEHVAVNLGSTVHHNPLLPTHVGYVRGLDRLLRDGQYDVVHSHEFSYSGIGVAVARHANVPVICTFHHWESPPQTRLTRLPGVRNIRSVYTAVSLKYSLRRANYITALSTTVLSRIKPDYRESPNCRLLSLSTAIPNEDVAEMRASVRAEHGWPLDTPVVMHAGRFIEQKNHEGVLAVFRRVRASLPNAKLLLMGVGPLLAQIQKEIETTGLSESVRYLGLRDDVPRLLRGADVFLFPSVSEGFGLVALEANAAGLPVVGSNIPGLDEAVVNGETAMLHGLTDIEGMAQSVLRFLRDRSAAADFGARGRKRAENQFSHESAANKIRALYRECTGL